MLTRRALNALLLAGAVTLAAPSAQEALAQGAPKVAKIGHLEAPTQPRHKGLEKVAALVKEMTKGQVELQLFPSSQLGNARQMIESTQFGAIEGTVMPAAFLGGFNPVISVLDIPYIFPTDRAASQKLRDSAFGKALLESFNSRGVHALTLWPNGRKSLTSNKPLAALDAFRGQKFRVMDSKILIDQFGAVGATAVAINFSELYTSLQTGLIDGQENPLDTITTMKLHEVQKYLVVTEHGAMEDVVLFSRPFWNGLTADQRAAITKAFDQVRPEVEQMKEDAQKTSLETVRAAKVNVRVADEAERNALRDVMAPKSRQTYLERAGAEGKKVLETYDAARKSIGL